MRHIVVLTQKAEKISVPTPPGDIRLWIDIVQAVALKKETLED